MNNGVVRLQATRGFNEGYFTNIDSVPYIVNSGATLELAGDWITRSNSSYTINGGTISTQAPGGNLLYRNTVIFGTGVGTISGPSGSHS